MSHRIPDRHIIALARDLFREHGPDLTCRRFCQLTGISQTSIASHFGGWLPFKKRLGFKPVAAPRARVAPEHTAQALLSRFKELARQHGPDIRLHRFAILAGVSPSLIYCRFGSWTELRRQAGITEINRPDVRITNESLLADMIRITTDAARPVTKALYRRHGWASYPTIIKRFTDWRVAFALHARFAGKLCDDFKDPLALRKRIEELIAPLKAAAKTKPIPIPRHATPQTHRPIFSSPTPGS